MTISTYAQLQSYITAHLELDSTAEAQLPTMIQLAEAELARMLTVPDRELVAYAVTVAGEQTLALPTGFAQVRQAMVDDDYPLAPVTLNVLQSQFAGDSASGKPQAFAIANQSLYFGPIPDAEYTITLTYLGPLDALSESNTSNWLLASHPDAYVYAVLLQAEAFLTNDERLPLIQSKLEDVMAQINRAGNRYRSSAPTRLRSPVVV